jgi:hypothetical protein
MSGATQVTWHHNVRRADGTPYPTRNRLEDGPEHGDIDPITLGLSQEDSRAICAVHELGHAVVWLAGGIHVASLHLEDGFGGQAVCVSRSLTPTMSLVIGTVAGERAVDRWLRQTGLWTPSLAAMAEVTAAHDRASVFSYDPQPRPGFGDGDVCYSVLHDLADEALDAQWDRILDVLPDFIRTGCMTGDELASRIGLPNTPNPDRPAKQS